MSIDKAQKGINSVKRIHHYIKKANQYMEENDPDNALLYLSRAVRAHGKKLETPPARPNKRNWYTYGKSLIEMWCMGQEYDVCDELIDFCDVVIQEGMEREAEKARERNQGIA